MALVDGVTILAACRSRHAVFTALHEPFEEEPRIDRLARVAQTPKAVAVRVIGKPGSGVDDRLMVRLGDDPDEPVTLEGDDERFVFADFAFVRVNAEAVTVRGDLRAMRLDVGPTAPGLIMNGKRERPRIADGFMTWTR
jgi:hypothetical protein